MVTTAKSFLIATAIDIAVGVLCFIAFCVLRRMSAWRRYYAPKRFLKGISRPRAPGWGVLDCSWIRTVWQYTEDEVLEVAGWDSVVYLRILRFGAILFAFLTFWTWAVVLPTNIVGGTYIEQLTASPVPTTSPFTYWIPPYPPPEPPGGPPASPAPEIKPPTFYNSSLPPAPPGLKWMEYLPGVPVLPPVASVLGPAYSNYVWAYDESYQANDYKFSNLDKASVANIPPRSNLLVAHVISAWVMSIATWVLLWSYAKKSVALRVRYFTTLSRGAESHTVLVQDIPGFPFGTKVVISSLDEKAMFQTWGASEIILQSKSMAQVTAVEALHETTKLEGLVAQYEKLNKQLWDLIGDYSSKRRAGKNIKRQQVRVVGALLGDWGKQKFGLKPVKRDALEYWPQLLAHMKDLIQEEQAKALQTDAPCAFVTFRSRRAAAVAASTMINHDLSIYRTSAAPPPDTLFWGNLRWRQWERSARSALIWSAFWALSIFYIIPVAAVQALVNVSLLQKIPPFKQLLEIPFINAIIVSILPGLVLKIFLAVMPMLLTFMNKRAGMQSKAEIDFGVFQKLFIFQVITVFFGTFIVGSFLSQFNQWLTNPASAINLLGTAIPQTASFFLTYMALSAFWTVPFGGLSIIGLILYWVKGKTASTEAARARLWQDQYAKYGADVASHTLSILLGLVYCIIQPVMAPLVLCYFLTFLFISKYQAIYVLRPAYESGGKMWPVVHGQVITGLIIAQLVLTFVFAIKKAIWAPIVTANSVIVSLLFHSAVKKRFFPPQQQMTFRGATDGDHNDEAKDGQSEVALAGRYLNPAFKFGEEDHVALLQEADNLNLVLKGERGNEALITLVPEEEDDSEGGPPLDGIVHTLVDDYKLEQPVLGGEAPFRASPIRPWVPSMV